MNQPLLKSIPVFRSDGSTKKSADRAATSRNDSKRAREIVFLVDADTDFEVQDGETLRVIGAPDDGVNDSVEVMVDVSGLLQGDPIDQYQIRYRIDGKELPVASRLEGQVGVDLYRYRGTIPLGFDVKAGQRADLDLRVQIPSGGISRWLYEDLGLWSGCSWSLRVDGSSRDGAYRGANATFADLKGRLVVSIGGNGADGNVIIVTLPAIAPGTSRTMEIGAKSSGTAASYGFVDEGDGNPTQMMFLTGDGSKMRGPGGKVVDTQPGPSRITVRRSADGTLTGRLQGRAWAQKSMQDYRLDKPDMDLTFTAREWMSTAIAGSDRGEKPDIAALMGQEPCGGFPR